MPRAAKTASKAARPALRPRANGRGALLAGGVPGNRGGTGRPPKLIRAGLREAIPAEVAKLEANVARLEALVAEFDALPLPVDPDTAERERQAAADVKEAEASGTPAPPPPPMREAEIDRRASRIRARMALEERLMAARGQLLDYCGKYGLGTTITETDDAGNTPPGRLTEDERRAEVLRILAERN